MSFPLSHPVWNSTLILALFLSSTSFAGSPLDADTGATLRRGLGPEPDSLHIHRAQGLAAVNVLRDLREGLVSYGPDGEPVPGGSHRWTISEDGKRWTFELRPEARWSNGDPVIADDFVRGFRRALSPETAGAMAGLLSPIEGSTDVLSGRKPAEELGVLAVSDHSLEIRLVSRAPWLAEILAHPVSYPLHPDRPDDPRESPVNGPFELSEWTPHAQLVLKRNAAYHDASNVGLERVVYHPVEEPAAELARFRAGELDITETIPTGRYEWLRENLPGQLRIHPYLGSFWLGLNLNKAQLKSADFRRALSLAIDRETLVRVILGSATCARRPPRPASTPRTR